MTYGDLVNKVREEFQSADVSSVKEHIAVQFNVYGEGEGALYLEISDGKADVQPYEYYDRDAIIISTADELVDIVTGKLDIVEANNSAKIQVEGSIEKAAVLSSVIAAKSAKAAKKPVKAEKPAKEEKAVKTAKAAKTEKSCKKTKNVKTAK